MKTAFNYSIASASLKAKEAKMAVLRSKAADDTVTARTRKKYADQTPHLQYEIIQLRAACNEHIDKVRKARGLAPKPTGVIQTRVRRH